MSDLSNTQFIRVSQPNRIEISDVLEQVYKALKQKGYNTVSQLVGYLMSGDPTYITSYNNARNLIMKVERDGILEELIKHYVDKM